MPARWRGNAGSSPLNRARTAASSPRNDLVKDCRVHPTHWLISTQRVAQRIGHGEDDQRAHRREERQLAGEEEHRRPRRRDGPREHGLAHLFYGVVELLPARRETLSCQRIANP